MKEGKLLHPGKVPTEVSVEQAQEAARQCAINIIAAVKSACGGDLDRVERCMQVLRRFGGYIHRSAQGDQRRLKSAS